MCGIAGFNWEDPTRIRLVTSLLEHRGPEQDGFHVRDGISIGHKRLRILDLSEKGRQPMYSEDGDVCISYNGEVYNFEALRTELQKAGHRFESRTDTEVLVHGYEEWGTGLLERINGQFAFCIFDRNRDVLFLARDRLGIKPLYYYSEGGRFIFGSEMKVFLKSDIEKRISRDALDYYLLFGNTPSEQSILAGVRKLPAGSYMIYDLAKREIGELSRYWSLSFKEDAGPSEETAARQIKESLERSVRMRLVSDVPLGAFLSGGVDSSIVVALMRPHVRELNTFSIKFDRPGYNESMYAKMVSEKFGTDHHEIEFDAGSVRDLIEELPYYYDEPFGDPSMIPTCLVCRVARKYVTVSLSGTGGDELFAGYPRYREFVALKRLNGLPGLLKGVLALGARSVNAVAGSDKLNKLQSFLGPRQEDWKIYLKLFSYMFRDRAEDPGKLDGLAALARHFGYGSDITNALNFDINEYLPECLLTKEDRASMAVSLEVRVPFLDHCLVELASGIGAALKIRGSQTKYILKQAFADVLPDAVLSRRKQGFSVPLSQYFRSELRDFAGGVIFDHSGPGCFDRGVLEGLWRRHQKGRSDYSRLFWCVMMYNLWYRRWMT